MPIQFPDFQRISFDEANPWLVGAERGQKLIQSNMMFPQDLQAKMLANQIAAAQAKFAMPQQEAATITAKQHNIYDPQMWKSTMGLQGAQAAEATASAGKTNKETQWYDKEAASRIGLQNAQTAGLNATAGIDQLKLAYMKANMAQNPAQTNTSSQPFGYGAAGATGAGGAGMPMTSGAQSAPATAPTAGAGYSTPGISSPAANSMYGIETPTLTSQDIGNKMVLGIDTFTPRMQNAKTQQQDQYTQYQKELAQTIQQANSAQKARQVLAMFNNAMDNTGMKGAYWGTTPSEGWQTLYHPAGSVTNAQIADKAVANLLPGAISELREAMGQANFSNLDMQNSSQMKVSRTMDDATRRTQSDWLNGVYNRMDEKAKFYTAMGNPSSGAQKVNADMLWEQYQNEFPLISDDGKTFQGGNLGNWPLYTTPRAIASIQATGTYKPSAAEKSSFMMKLPNGEVVPIKKGKIEAAFRKGARPL